MKRRKSAPGNVVYVMIHFPCIWWVKIGITQKTAKRRAKGIDRSMWGIPVPIFAVPLPWAYEVEQWLHGVLSPLSCRFYKGDGCTEWFWLPAVLFAIPVLILLFALLVAFWAGVFLLAIYWISQAT